MSKKYEIFGPSTGSSKITLSRSLHNRVIIKAENDFGEANCAFTKDQGRKIRDALNELLGE